LQRRKSSRVFKLGAANLVRGRGVTITQAGPLAKISYQMISICDNIGLLKLTPE
jgi:hypothetical protein